LTARELLLVYYESIQAAYGWTVEEIDRQSAAFMLDQLAAKVKAEAPDVSIEDFL